LRRVWWSEPGFLLFSALYLVSGGVFIFWISKLEFPIAAQALGIFWIIMFPVIILMYKRILSEPRVYVKQSVLDETAHVLKTHHRKVRAEFVKGELAQLERKEKCDVLDIWKIDPALSARHYFFAATRTLKIDPVGRECHIRIQVRKEDRLSARVDVTSQQLLFDTIEYVKLISSDGYLLELGRFFDRLVLVIDIIDLDERGSDIYHTVVSFLVDSQALSKLTPHQSLDAKQLARIGDLRFDNGNPVESHRDIELPLARGAK
jgi:hypothetical protein